MKNVRRYIGASIVDTLAKNEGRYTLTQILRDLYSRIWSMISAYSFSSFPVSSSFENSPILIAISTAKNVGGVQDPLELGTLGRSCLGRTM